ncbi:MAG: hypothetical protein J2P17_15420, partial [Mycobacterium sp.]|nr:hypothetical protein [Mycobacterium sp.]
YRGVPDKVDTNIAINGLTDAINDLDTLLRQINGLHDKTITINEHVYTYQDPANTFHGYALGGMRRAAVGMYIPPRDPGTVLVGEPQTGGEMLTPLRGISQAAAMMQTKVIGDAYGFDVVPRHGGGGSTSINITVSASGGGSDLDRAMSSWFMGAVRKGDIQITASRN